MIGPKTVRLRDVLKPAAAKGGRGRTGVRRSALLARALLALAGAVPAAMAGTGDVGTAHETPVLRRHTIPPALETRILALDPANLSANDVSEVLRYGPAPRIVALQGSVPLVTMQPFADFLVAMGYPAPQLVDPETGERSYSSYIDSDKLAGLVAWFYEHDGLMPMLVGHSQGGMVVMKTLHELAGAFRAAIPVWNPQRATAELRTTIVDPLTGQRRPVVGLRISYAAALATGALPRVLLGQWDMLARLREVPDSVAEFTGFVVPWDLIAGTGPRPKPYRAVGSATVRTVTLPASTGHIGIPRARHLAENPVTRAWIDGYRPGGKQALPTGVDTTNLIHAADIWYSVRRHWCLEAQRLIQARRSIRRRSARGEG